MKNRAMARSRSPGRRPPRAREGRARPDREPDARAIAASLPGGGVACAGGGVSSSMTAGSWCVRGRRAWRAEPPGAKRRPATPASAAPAITSGKGTEKMASAAKAATAMATWKGARSAREPMRTVAASDDGHHRRLHAREEGGDQRRMAEGEVGPGQRDQDRRARAARRARRRRCRPGCRASASRCRWRAAAPRGRAAPCSS